MVRALGEQVTGFSVGDRVFGRARGTHSEQVLFDAAHLKDGFSSWVEKGGPVEQIEKK